MDTSTEYIKMCDCPEVQDVWEPFNGDWLKRDYHGLTGFDPEVEERIWGNDEKKWIKIEILCYRPNDAKDYWICTRPGEEHSIVSTVEVVKKNTVWLPRMDQLLSMLREHNKDFNPFTETKKFLDYSGKAKITWFDTEEQVLLNVFMLSKHGKRWRDGTWQ